MMAFVALPKILLALFAFAHLPSALAFVASGCHPLPPRSAEALKLSMKSASGCHPLPPRSAEALRLSMKSDADGITEHSSRRSFILSAIVLGTSSPACATLMDNKQEGVKTFQPGTKLSVEEAKDRFQKAREEIKYLLEHYQEISEGGGDAVRRYIGTVGVNSNMYGITKVVKELREEADDVVEFTETANEFEAYLFQAEGAAYQSLFVEHSSAKGTPASFLATAKKDVEQMKVYMDQLATQLNL